MITRKLLLAAIAATSVILPAQVPAQQIRIELGDRPYYRHGPQYWSENYEMVWVPGHWSAHRRWIHGHYVRGENRRHDSRRHHNDDYYRNNHR